MNNNDYIANALLEYVSILKYEMFFEDINYIDNELNVADKINETAIDLMFMESINESSKSNTVKKSVSSAVSAFIRKLKAIASQILAFIKKLAGISRIPTSGKYIDIGKSMNILDKIISDGYDGEIPLNDYHTGEKIDNNKLQSLINRCNKVIDIIQNKSETGQIDTNETSKRLKVVQDILREANRLMKSLIRKNNDSPEEAKERFKKKYKYDPKSRTIEVHGERYKVRMSNDKDTTARGLINKEDTVDQRIGGTSANLLNKKGGIYLDDNFWQLDNDENRAAILAHEIGHLKYHSYNAKSRHLDKETVVGRNIEKSSSISGMNKGSYENSKKMNEINKKYKNSERNKQREENIKRYKRYENPNIQHANVDEFEADRYAANYYGEKTLKKALKNAVKVALKKENYNKAYEDQIEMICNKIGESFGEDNDADSYKKFIRSLMNNGFMKTISRFTSKIQNNGDLKARFKALKDTVVKAEVYGQPNNESSELLTEAFVICESVNDVEDIFDIIIDVI